MWGKRLVIAHRELLTVSRKSSKEEKAGWESRSCNLRLDPRVGVVLGPNQGGVTRLSFALSIDSCSFTPLQVFGILSGILLPSFAFGGFL